MRGTLHGRQPAGNLLKRKPQQTDVPAGEFVRTPATFRVPHTWDSYTHSPMVRADHDYQLSRSLCVVVNHNESLAPSAAVTRAAKLSKLQGVSEFRRKIAPPSSRQRSGDMDHGSRHEQKYSCSRRLPTKNVYCPSHAAALGPLQ